MSTIDWTKPIRTKDGREAVLLPWTGKDQLGLRAVAVKNPKGNIDGWYYNENGIAGGDTLCRNESLDLENVPESVTEYVNVYASAKNGVWLSHIHDTRVEADAGKRNDLLTHLAVLRITRTGDEIECEVEKP